MSAGTIVGFVVMLIGGLLAGDAKTIGQKTPAAGIAIVGLGFFIAAFSFYGQSGGENRGGSGRRVKDHSI